MRLASSTTSLPIGSKWSLVAPLAFALLFAAVSPARASEIVLFAEAAALLRQVETSESGARGRLLQQARERLHRIVAEYPNTAIAHQLKGRGVPVLGGESVSLAGVDAASRAHAIFLRHQQAQMAAPPEPTQQAGTGTMLPVARPQERSQSVLDIVERLRAVQQTTAPPAGRSVTSLDREIIVQTIAIERETGNIDARIARSTAFLARRVILGTGDDAVSAIADLTETLRTDPRSARALAVRAAAHRVQENTDAASTDLRAAAALARDEAQATAVRPIGAPQQALVSVTGVSIPTTPSVRLSLPPSAGPMASAPVLVPTGAAASSVRGAPQVISTAVFMLGGERITLAYVEGLDGAPARGVAAFIASRGGAVTCDPAPPSVGMRCLTDDRVDLAEAALLTGGARATADAPPAYRAAEIAARQARRGVWAEGVR